jgi:NTP pyrophosphatase (non-canonical NTP hydrolase)
VSLTETYLEATRGTEPPSEGPEYYALGLVEEAGEVAGAVKKGVYHGRGRAETAIKVLEEAGDTLWYLTRTLRAYGWSLEEALIYNAQKLAKRYPKGYSHAASKARADEKKEG